MKIRKLFKLYFLIPLILLIGIALLFIVWQFLPKTELSIAVLDKTVPATQADGFSYLDDVDNDYRKHIGLYWLLNYKKIVNPQTGEYYDYETDYYGNKIDADRNITEETALSECTSAPDLLYLSDAYGVESSDSRGITQDDMNTISYAHSAGSVIVGEQDILENGTSAEVSAQLQELFGIQMTGWVGRYIYDLQDFTDVPEWAPPMYEEKYGQKWLFTGPGLLLVGNGDIIVLEESTCFQSKNLLKISVAEGYEEEFGKHSVNFYNWFEIITPAYGTETIATYTFNLNADGMEEFSKISDQNVFCAVARNTSDGAPTYYFAGDFNDYVDEMQLSSFCFADTFFRLISFDRDGDVKNFYWNFYEPMMEKILDDIIENPLTQKEEESPSDIAQITPDGMQVKSGEDWTDFEIKGFNINAALPGSDSASRDYESYQALLEIALDTGANTIRVYDLLPPEFYRALYNVNAASEDGTLYLIQSIAPPDEITGENAVNTIDDYRRKIEQTVRAVYGDGSVTNGEEEYSYQQDMSQYLLAFEITPDLTDAQVTRLIGQNGDFSYSGTYFSATDPMESYLAALCDHVLQTTVSEYGCKVPVGAQVNPGLLPDVVWNEGDTSCNPGNIQATQAGEGYLFSAVTLLQDDNAVVNFAQQLSYTDSEGDYPFGGYVSQVIETLGGEVLVDGVSASTAVNMYEKDSTVYGLSEEEQGEALVRMLEAVEQSGALGGLVSDLNDSWSGLSEEEDAFTVPKDNNCMWFNAADKEQTKGVVAIEPNTPDETGMELNDNNGRVSQIQLSHNEGYLYITVLLSEDIDYDEEQLFIGFDTVQRNDGEYYYSSDYFANSLSGMEFVIEFESRVSASLYVTPSYNRSNGQYQTQESYTGEYDLVAVLNYGSFDESNTQFFQTGSTVRLRIPWSMLNVTDPVGKLVIDDETTGALSGDVKTTVTEGALVSILIGNKEDQDTTYIFPVTKKSPGYKVYEWSSWETVDFTIRSKQSCSILRNYFNG